MQATAATLKCTSISNTLDGLSPYLISNLLAAHALSGCGTVPQLYGISKKKALKLLKSHEDINISLLENLDPAVEWSSVEESCRRFICALYGHNENITLDEIRYEKWLQKTKANTMTSVSKLKCLPPTFEAA